MGLSRILARKVANYDNNNSIGSRLRGKRIKPLTHIIENHFNDYGHVNIVDIGGTRNYWNVLPQGFIEANHLTITIVNLPGANPVSDEEHFKYVDGDACSLSEFKDNSFHIAHSNSVVEHVGNWDKMTLFANEIKRVATSYFVQTPSFWFPFEPHFMAPFFHWLPEPVRVSLVMKFELGKRKKCETVDEAVRMVQSVNLLDEKEFRTLFDDAEVIREKIFMMTKSLVAIRN